MSHENSTEIHVTYTEIIFWVSLSKSKQNLKVTWLRLLDFIAY